MKLFLIILLFPVLMAAQQKGEMITITGDSLTGKIVSGEMIREVIGNVVLKQKGVVITCDKAIQFMARNDANLIGNVIIKEDTLTIETPEGFYYGDERIAESKSGVKLNDTKVILTAKNGSYYFNEARAFFTDNVKLYDTVSTLTCRELTYLKKENKVIAINNVTITDSLNTVEADSLIHLRDKRITIADQNVKITNLSNNIVIYGGHLEDYSKNKYSIVTENPVMVQLDTLENKTIDTLVISSLKMESYNDSSKKFIATDSVKVVRGEFASKNSYSIYFKNEERIFTFKKENDVRQPVLWYEFTQLTGDSINIFIEDNQLQKVEAKNNSFILSQNENYNVRYDQISGNEVIMHFDSTGIHHVDVTGQVLSIYYMYEEDEPNGLTKSSAQRAKVFFDDEKAEGVSEVKLYGSPMSEYHPENLVLGNELSFTLPSFIIYYNRPIKVELLKGKHYSADKNTSGTIIR